MPSKRQIQGGAILAYVSIVLNLIAGLIYTPWMIEQVGSADYGLYTLANSLITMFLIDFGMGSVTNRYVSKYRAEGRQDKIYRILGVVYKIYLSADLIILSVLAVVYCLINRIYVSLTIEELEKLRILYLIAGVFAVVNFPFAPLNGILNAYEKFVQLKASEILYRLMLVALMCLALLAGYGVYALVIVHAFVGVVLIVYKLIVIKRYTPVKVDFSAHDPGIYKEIFSFSIWETITPLASRMIFSITPSILGTVSNSFSIALFGVVATIEGYIYTFANAISGMFMPRLARIYETDDANEKVMPLFIAVGRYQCALNGLLIAGFIVLGKQFVQLWMGSAYQETYYGIMLVIIPGVFYSALQIGNTAMIVQKRVDLQAYISVIMGVLNVILSIPLSLHYGMIGACTAIFVSYIFRVVALNVVFQKILKFDMFFFFKKCYLKMSSPIIGSIALGFVLNRVIADSGWYTMILKGMIVVGIYLGLLGAFALESSERQKIAAYVKSTLKKDCR